MAMLKDSLIAGDLRVTGTIYGDVPLDDLVDADDLKAIEALSGTSGILKKTAANTWTLDTSSYTTTSGTVTSVRVQATSPVVSSVNTAQSATLNTTISLADGYGDTKNPYASKTARYVLAAPASAAGAPTFRALTNADVGLSNVENTKLSTWAGSSNITTIGTLSAGTVPWERLTGIPGSMTPSSHAHGNITNDGKIGTAANKAAYTTTNGVVTAGTLPAAAGGTGKTTLKDAANALINALETGSSNLTANDYVITQYVGGGTTTTTYHRRPASAIRVGGLLTGKKLKVKLDSTTDVTFDGTADQTAIPVSGTLPVAHGGTGATSLANITVGKATADASGNTITSTYATKTEMNALIAAADAMVFKGVLDGAATTTYTPAADRGHTYKVATAGLINGEKVEVGDILICITDSTAAATSSNVSTVKANWVIVQTNIDGAVTGPTSATDGNIPLFDGTTGKLISDSGYSPNSFALVGHTHTTSLASDTGTSTVTLTSGGKFKLTAGGTSVIFTMPTSNDYSHPTGDGNSHIPATGTTSNGKFLVAGSTANSAAWKTVKYDKATSLTQSQNVTLKNATAATVTSAGTWPTLGTAFTIPNISSKQVVVSATATQISGSTDDYKITLTTGDSVTTGTAFTVPNVTSIGTAPTFGTTTVAVDKQPTFTINHTSTALTISS